MKAINFEVFLANKTTGILAADNSITKQHAYNYTSFSSTPRVSVSIKSYGVIPSSIVTSLSIGFKLTISNINRTNFTYTVSAIGASLVALHYQYFAVVGYANLYYMDFYIISRNVLVI